MADSLIVKLGADTSEFRGQIAAATSAVKGGFGEMDAAGAASESTGIGASLKGIHHAFRQLRELFLLGGGMGLVLNWFDSLTAAAEKSKDLIDSNVDSTRRWGEEWKGIKSDFQDFGVQLLGFLAKAGRGWGDLITATAAGAKNLFGPGGFVAGFAAATVEIKAGNAAEEESRKGLQNTEAAIAEANKQRKISEESAKRQAEIEKHAAENEQAWLEFKKQMAELDKQLAKLAYDKLTPEQQLLDLQKQRYALNKTINDKLINEEDHKKALIQAGILDKDIQTKILEIEKARIAAIAAQTKAKIDQQNYDAGVLKIASGFATYNTPEQQQAYEKQLIESARADTQQEIASLQNQIDAYTKSGSGLGKYEIPALQQRIQALRGRENHLQDYVFNPNYQDPAGKGIFATQVSTIGDPLKLQTKANDTLAQVAGGVSELNTRLRTAGFGTGK